jgi:hypothetical protein
MIISQHASHDRAVFAIALLVLSGAVFFCVLFAYQDDTRHLLVRVADDASYYLTTARNIAAGRGMTFDGIHPSNGFQPLWLLLLAPLFLVHGSPETMLRLVVLLQGALLVIAFLLLYQAHSKQFSPRTALVSAILFVFLVAMPCVNGMESALLVLLLVALYGYGLRIAQTRVTAARALWFGAILGLVILARLDMIFIPLALLGCSLRYVLDRTTRPAVMAPIVMAGLGCAVVLIPYLLFNYTQFGSMMPISGVLKSSFPALALTSGTLEAVGSRHYACVLLAAGWLIGRSVRTGSAVPAPGESYYTWSTTALAWAVILHFLYTVLFMKWGVFAWYFVLYRLFVVLLAAAAIESILNSNFVARTPAAYWTAVALVLAAGFVRQYSAERYPLNGSWHASVYDAALWAREHTAENAVFAMSDSGDFAFFSCRRVINLDGLANNMEYQQAIADRRLNQYLQSNHVQYLVQHAVHGHDEVVRGNYDGLALSFESRKFGEVSDAVLLRRQDEVYRSRPYFDGADRVVLLIWSLADGAHMGAELAAPPR